MARWIVKAAIQRLLGFLPGRHFWNGLIQERISKSTQLKKSTFEKMLRTTHQHYAYFLQHSGFSPGDPFTVFELGTGWHPILPVALFLCGARTVWTFDIAPLLKMHRVKETLEMFVEHHQSGQLQELLPHADAQRVDQLYSLKPEKYQTPQELLASIQIDARTGNAAQSGLEQSSIDLIVSNVVLEYITPEPMTTIFQELHRLASANAVMSHDVDLADQYAYFDSSITPYNFLRFSPLIWRIINNPFIPLNRLQVSDYREVHRASQFEIVEEKITNGRLEDLQRVPLAKKFQQYPQEELLAVQAWFVSRPVNRDVESTTLPDARSESSPSPVA